MRKCCVPGCHSNYGKPYVPTFLFPKDNERRKLWENSISGEAIKVTNNIGVCIKHFEEHFIVREDCFVNANMEVVSQARKKVKLKSNAYPTILEPSSPSESYSPLNTSEEISKGVQMKRAKLKKEALPSLNLPYSSEQMMGTNVAKEPVLLQKLLQKSSTTNRPIITVVKAEGIGNGEPSNVDLSDDDEVQIIKHEIVSNRALRHSFDNSQGVSVGLKPDHGMFSSRGKTSLKRRSSSVGSNSSEGSNELFKSSGPKRKKPDKPFVTGRKNDSYCWVCHKEGVILSCMACPRAFHHRCAGELDYTSEWVCPECRRITTGEDVDTRSQTLSEISLDKFCALLKCSLNKLKARAPVAFHQPVPVEYYSSYLFYVIHPMDLSLIEKNIKLKSYGCTESFLADVKWILHNSCVFNGAQHPLTASARTLVKSCEYDMGEIDVCPECFLHSCTRSKYWFSDVCRKPHPLVWAKLKGFPYWPAKIVRILDGNVDARFFGAHDRAWVPMSQCYHLSKEMPTSSKPKKKGTYESALDELNVHVHLLMQKYGKFEYAPYRTPFDAENKIFMYHGIEVDKIPLNDDLPYEVSPTIRNDVQAISPITSILPSYDLPASEDDIPHCSSDSFKMGSSSEKASLNSHVEVESRSHSPLPHSDELDAVSDETTKAEKKTVPSGIFEISEAVKFDAPTNLELNINPLLETNSLPKSNSEDSKKFASVYERIREFINNENQEINESEREDNKCTDPDIQNAMVQCSVETSSAGNDVETSKQVGELSKEAIKETEDDSLRANELVVISTNKSEPVVPIALPKKNDSFALKLDETIESCKAKLGITNITAEDAGLSGSESWEEDECDKEMNSSSSEVEDEQSGASSSSDDENSDEDVNSNSSGTDLEIVENAEKIKQSPIKTETPISDEKLVAHKTSVDESKSKGSVIDLIELSSDSDSDNKIILEDKIFVDISKIAVPKDFEVAKNNCLNNIATDFGCEELHADSTLSFSCQIQNVEVSKQKSDNVVLPNASINIDGGNIPLHHKFTMNCFNESVNVKDFNNAMHMDQTIKGKPVESTDNVTPSQSHDIDKNNCIVDETFVNKSIEHTKICDETENKLPISGHKETANCSSPESSESLFLKALEILKNSSEDVGNALPLPQSPTEDKFKKYSDSEEGNLSVTSSSNIADNSSFNEVPSVPMSFDFNSIDSELLMKSTEKDDPVPSTSQLNAIINSSLQNLQTNEIKVELQSPIKIEKEQDTKEKTVAKDVQSNSDVQPLNSSVNPKSSSDISDLPNDIEKMKKDLSCLREELSLMQLKFKKQSWFYAQEKKELRHNMNLAMMEMRTCLETNHKETIDNLKEQLRLEKTKCVEETKRKQWCANCRQEAMFHCCWNTSYCSHSCQKHHWPKHRHTCAQMKSKSSTPAKPATVDFVKITKKSNANLSEGPETNKDKKVILLNVKPSEVITPTVATQNSSVPDSSVDNIVISQPQTQMSATKIQLITTKNQLQLVTSAPSQSPAGVPLQFLPNSPVQLVLTSVNPSSEKAASQTPFPTTVTQGSAEIFTKVRSRQTDYNTAIQLLNMMNKQTEATLKPKEVKSEDTVEELFFSLSKPEGEVNSMCSTDTNVDTDSKSDCDTLTIADDEPMPLDDEPALLDDCSDDTECELISIGHGVEIKAKALERCIACGTTPKKLARCLMDALFPSTETLANSCIIGRKSNITKQTRPALPTKIVNAIIDFVSQKFGFFSQKDVLLAMNLKCREARRSLFKSRRSPKNNKIKTTPKKAITDANETPVSSVTPQSGLTFSSGSDSSASQSLQILSRLVTPTVKTVSSAIQVVSQSKTASSSECITRLVGVPRILQCAPSNQLTIAAKPKPHFVATDTTTGITLPWPSHNSLQTIPAIITTQSPSVKPLIAKVDCASNSQTVVCSVTNSPVVKHLNTSSNSNLSIQSNAISEALTSLQNSASTRNPQSFLILGTQVSAAPK